jgi:hypothetical protein
MNMQKTSGEFAAKPLASLRDEMLNVVTPLTDRVATGKYKIEVQDAPRFSTTRLSPIKHNFHEHPLMQLDRLSALAESLSLTGQCRFISPGTTESAPFDHKGTSPDGRTVRELFTSIEKPGSWIALYNVQTDSAYAGFLREVMASIDHVVSREEKVFDIRGFIFISAPPSVTPFHIDRENNFWLNMRGRKTLSVWDRADRSVVAGKDVEEFIMYRMLENVTLTDASREKRIDFDCGPGDGVYFPATTPHMTRSDASWARPGDGVSVSMGIDFYTNVTKRNAYLYSANRLLRRFGITPREPGVNGLGDTLKYALGRTSVALRKRLRGYVPPPGF